MSVVREERGADAELLELCRNGSGKQSPKMRTACLQAQSDRASPLILKAIVRAVSTTFREFAESVNSPFGFATVALFVLSSLVLPIGPLIKALCAAWPRRRNKVTSLRRYGEHDHEHDSGEDDSDEDDVEDKHVVFIGGGGVGSSGVVKRRPASRFLKNL
jgi:hypothetical protein